MLANFGIGTLAANPFQRMHVSRPLWLDLTRALPGRLHAWRVFSVRAVASRAVWDDGLRGADAVRAVAGGEPDGSGSVRGRAQSRGHRPEYRRLHADHR